MPAKTGTRPHHSHASGRRGRHSRRPGRWRARWLLLPGLASLIFLPYGCQMLKPLPDGLDYAGPLRPAGEIEFLHDLTWVDDAGTRHSDQQIFDEALRIIGAAERLIVLDMFLYNPWLGAGTDPARRLSGELTEALVARKRAVPGIGIIVITDPINTVYGGADSDQFDQLREQGIEVVTTQLDGLRDSNPVYSFIWRVLVRPFGNGEGSLLPNPFGAGRVSLRSYLRLLNFKANHRKTLVADAGGEAVALVTSANPHDGSSAHTNIGVRFTGSAVLDLLRTENAVLELSGHPPFDVQGVAPAAAAAAAAPAAPAATPTPAPVAAQTQASTPPLRLQILTESRIKLAIIESIEAANVGDRLHLAMFYLSDRDIIEALKAAGRRGVGSRILLDPNKDAFGRRKNGVPARPVAHELDAAGLPVRWCDTHGEQCHMKMLLVDYADGASTLIAGSANFTRRNLENFNLETNIAVRGPATAEVMTDARAFFDLMWSNEPGRNISTDYATYADPSIPKRVLYRFMEGSGISTF